MNAITAEIYNDLDLLSCDITGWNGLNPIFKSLIEEYRPKHIIEVGTWKGQSAINMGECCKALELSCKITCVDTWLGSLEFWDNLSDTSERSLMLKNGYPQIFYQFVSNVVHKGLQDIILPFPITSSIAAKYFKKRGITADLIYIDGSHEYEDVLSDLNSYFPIATGAMFGDDYLWGGVKFAVDDFVAKNNLALRFNEHGEYNGNFWILKKRSR